MNFKYTLLRRQVSKNKARGHKSILVIPAEFPPRLNSHFQGCTPPSLNTHKMTHEERMTKALAALDLQEHPKYAPVAKEYSLERITLAKRHKGQTTSRAIAMSETRQCLIIA